MDHNLDLGGLWSFPVVHNFFFSRWVLKFQGPGSSFHSEDFPGSLVPFWILGCFSVQMGTDLHMGFLWNSESHVFSLALRPLSSCRIALVPSSLR